MRSWRAVGDIRIAAAAELELRRRERASLADLPLLDFVPNATPTFDSPTHLKPFADELETIFDKEKRIVCHTPPRHGKTEMLLHFIVRSLMRRPDLRIGYASYSSDLASNKSNKARRMAHDLGVDIVTDRADEWRTAAGGGLLARGVGGGWVGRGIDLLIIDDPVKDRAEAESPAYRNRVWDWFNDAAYNRIEPGGSVVVNMARWHQQDLAGKLIDEGWQYIRLPALCDSSDDLLGRKFGEALWPARWPIEKLNDRMRNEFTKASIYQGRPRPRGATLFRDVYYYDEPPTDGYRCAIGLDLAYTAKSHADYSVAVALASVGDAVYVLDVARHQIQAAAFGSMLGVFQKTHGGRARIYTGGGAEVAAVEYLARDFGVDVKAMPATVDKFVRAQPVATAWNEGRILLPKSASWTPDFIDEVCSFTGVSDDHDDQVDALAAGFDEVAVSMPFDYRAVSSRRYGHQKRGWA